MSRMRDDLEGVGGIPWTRFGAGDVRRLAYLLLAATELSTGGYVLIRYARHVEGRTDEKKSDHWRVNVRFGEIEHTSSAQVVHRARAGVQRWQPLILALDRAVQWLSTSTARIQLTRSEESNQSKSE